jgi:cardiolipin synthase
MKLRPLGGNRIDLLRCGAEYFPALIAAIDGALREILLETYIFERDATGMAVLDALRRAAARGVVVRLLVDGFGARGFVDAFVDSLAEDSIELRVFRRERATFSLRRHRLRRLHRKLVTVDGRIAFVGGINVVDDVDVRAPAPPRFDFAVRVEGPLVTRVHAAMDRLWRLVSWASFRHRRPDFDSRVVPGRKRVGDVHASFLLRDNLRHRRDIENAYLDAIRRARSEILIANAYFFPGLAFRHALVDAAERGVRVTLLLQGRVEYWLQYHACRVLYPQLMAAGVRVIEYRKSFLHAKVAVVDDAWATVGSSNIDPFSLVLAREANVVVLDAGFTASLRTALLDAIDDGGEELSSDHWRKLGVWQRLLDWVAYGLARIIIGLAGIARFAS